MIRDAGLLEAGAGAVKAAGRFGANFYKRDQELGRADIAVAERDIERAKGSADSASSQSQRAQDDIRDTLDAIRSYQNAKSQLDQAGIIRG